MKNSFLPTSLLLIIVAIFSCQPDDSGPSIAPPRDRGPQAIVDANKIKAFLNNYTYNDLDFNISEGVDRVKSEGLTHNDIQFIRIVNATTGAKIELTAKQKLISSGTSLLNSKLLDSIPNINVSGVNHTVYFLKIREGQGKLVTNIDPIFIGYRGNKISRSFIDETNLEIQIGGTFDNRELPVWLKNDENIIGFSAVTSQFKTAIPVFNPKINEIQDERQRQLRQCQVFETAENGTISTIENSYAIGAMFIPSGLGYYDNRNPRGQFNANGINPYENLLFTFSLYNTEYADLDNDGIPSLLEDLNRDNDYSNDDTDGDGVPNFVDADDDGDGTATISEITIDDVELEIDSNCDGILTNDKNVIFIDNNSNSIFDHLDATIK